jgi:hypothetical protein
MTSSTRPDKESENACFDLMVSAALWVGAVCLVCAVNYGAIHGVNPQLQGLFVVMHIYYGKWIVAGLAVFVGSGMCLSALRRMNSAPQQPPFREGAVYLASARWYRQSPPKRAVKVGRANR